MNERRADIAIVGVYFALVMMMMLTIPLKTRFALVFVIIAVCGLWMASQRGTAPFPPDGRRQLRRAVLFAGAGSAIAIYSSYVRNCAVWPVLILSTALTFLSLRVRLFDPPGSESE